MWCSIRPIRGVSMATAISPESVMALEILRAKQEGRRLEIEDISGSLLKLADSGFGLGDVALRWVPGGVYSDDVESFVGRLLAAGYARARSPIEFFDDGLRVCSIILTDEGKQNPGGLAAAASVLGFDAGPFISRTPEQQPA